MIFAVAILLLAIAGTPLFTLLALLSIVEFLSAPGAESWAPPTIDTLGRRCLDSPTLLAVPLLVVCVRLVGVSPVGARLRRVIGGEAHATFWLALLFYGVVGELPMRALVLSAALPALALGLGSVLVHRQVGWLAALGKAKWDVCAVLLAVALLVGGVLDLHEVAALGVLALLLCDPTVRSPAVLRGACEQGMAVVGAWLLVVVAMLGVGSWLEHIELGQWSMLTSYRTAVVMALGAEAARLAWPTGEHLAAAYLGERHGAPMTRVVRMRIALALLVLIACLLIPGVTAWLPALQPAS